LNEHNLKHPPPQDPQKTTIYQNLSQYSDQTTGRQVMPVNSGPKMKISISQQNLEQVNYTEFE
jgi:hypothetical protein